MQKAAFLNLKVNLSTESFKLAKTVYPVDKDGQYYAIVVIKQNPVIVTSDIKKTANKGNSIEIYFTLSGAKKWADLTKNNIGKKLAFVIDNEIYAMPDINGEINYGVAKISGLESETVAEKLSVSLNRSISN
jgi:preprotein translocase subunit SecD